MKKLTLVVGASENPERYPNMAIKRLVEHHHPVKAVGLKEGNVQGVKIEKGQPFFEVIDTVTLYVGPKNQTFLYDYLVQLKPKRVIFNPGTENLELEDLLQQQGIETERACTLVMLSTGVY
jgi:predicted CoA-binding protein